jgi:hypothetical protein
MLRAFHFHPSTQTSIRWDGTLGYRHDRSLLGAIVSVAFHHNKKGKTHEPTRKTNASK